MKAVIFKNHLEKKKWDSTHPIAQVFLIIWYGWYEVVDFDDNRECYLVKNRGWISTEKIVILNF